MGKVGRPPSGGNKKHRKAAREEYRKLSPAKKKARVTNRSKAAQQAADRKRYAKSKTKRNTYHKKTNDTYNKVKSGKMKRPSKCSNCGATGNIQYDHTKRKWLCAKCNNPANNS